jgi:hypothetical protein
VPASLRAKCAIPNSLLLIRLHCRPDEAISWGKIRLTAQPVKVYADATIVFPMVVAGTFYKYWKQQQQQQQHDE